MTINIRMCIITEDNISQMENMGFSNSLDSLLFQKNAVPKTVIDQTRAILANKPVVLESGPTENLPPPPMTPENSPPIKYIPHTPDYTPPTSVENSLASELTPENLPPNFIPPTPENSSPIPPSPENTPPMKEIKGGDKVHYRGDYNPSRLWTVQHTGDKFYTIDTDDLDGLSTEDSIKVITPEEIYLPEDFTYSMPYTVPENQMPYPNQNMIPNQNPNPNMNPCETQINFAPVIKIINDGNDMSSSSPSSEPVSGPAHISNEPLIPEQSTGQMKEAEPINFDKPIIIKKL